MEHRKDSSQQKVDPVVASGLDPDGKYSEWLNEHLCADPNCTMDPVDIIQGFENAFNPSGADSPEGHVMSPENMGALVISMFPGTSSVGGLVAHPKVKGVRWKRLEKCIYCDAVQIDRLPTSLQTKAHPLLHLPQPDRKKAWLRMYFKSNYRISMSILSIWGMYLHAFDLSADAHEIMEEEAFVECLIKTFKDSEEVEVADGHSVLRGVSSRFKPLTAEQVLAKKRQADYRRLAKTRFLEFPTQSRNVFTQKLLEDPLLSLPRTDEGPAPSPFIERLHRRQQNPREPLGDEEPGFPGVSMKAEQRRWKRKWEEMTKVYRPPTQSDWEAAAADVLATLPPIK